MEKVRGVVATASITPGTKFMEKLSFDVTHYFAGWSSPEVSLIIRRAGEGEHKIFDFIRKRQKEHSNQTTVIYGLDADLIMLTLNHLHISENMYLYRETPHFIRSIDRTLDPEKLYCIDIPELAASITSEMKCGSSSRNDTHIVHYYILKCYMLGNDYMPHFPSLNIRTSGTETLLEVYRATIGARGMYLTDEDAINWKAFSILIEDLASREMELLTEYARRARMKKTLEMGRDGPPTLDDKIQNLPITNKRRGIIYSA